MTAGNDHFAYLLECSDGSYYAGYTTDLQRRLAAHLGGTASKYTRAKLPVRMVYWQSFSSKGEAMSEEAKLKRLTHKQKATIVVEFGKILEQVLQ